MAGRAEAPAWRLRPVPARPEVIGGVQVSGMRPDLGCLAVLQVEDLDGVVLEVLARPLGPDCGQRDNVLVVADDVVQVDAYRPVRGLEGTAKPVQDLPDALIVAAERAPAREMPADAGIEEPGLQGFEVTSPECRVPSRTISSFGC